MVIKSLKTRFLLAGGLMALTTVSCGVWSATSLLHISRAAGSTLRTGQAKVGLVAVLSGSLEREDDAVVLAIGGRHAEAAKRLRSERQKFEDAYRALQPLLFGPEEQRLGRVLRRDVDECRARGDLLVGSAGQSGSLEDYNRTVNPALRRSVDDCTQLREVSFRVMEQAAVDARNEARRSALGVGGALVGALLLSLLISLHLMRRVVDPINVLTRFADAMREGSFEQRVKVAFPDELGRLASEFNRMAEALAEHRRFDLGQVLQAKAATEATLEALPDAVILVEPSGRVASMNRIARQVLGTRRSDDRGPRPQTRLEDLPLPPDAVQAVRDALRGLPPVPSRADLKGALSATVDGRPVKLLPSVVPVPQYRNGEYGAVAVLYDVTEFAKLDELRMELIAVASHELKTPLTTLRMNLLLLREQWQAFDDRQREFVANSIQGCEELGRTIDELLDLTRADAGQLRLSVERVDVLPLIGEALRGLRPRFEEAGITLAVAPGAADTTCRADPLRLSMVLTNILSNALKYTPANGKVSVIISSLQNAGQGPGPCLQIAVTDTGPGIPEEFRERVFDKFFRVEHHRPANGKHVRGTGIGLYLSKHIIQAHGGCIWCEPGDDGLGTRIAVSLPCQVDGLVSLPGC